MLNYKQVNNMDLTEIYKKSSLYNLIENDKKNNMLSNAYILYGENEERLKNYSINFAKQILCSSDISPCDNCNVCLKINKNVHSDVSVYPENGKTLKTEDSNKIVSESFVIPFESDYKIFILNNFEKATSAAQNKLLKALEETTKYTIFILNTSNINSVLSTIKSRCKKIYIPESESFELANTDVSTGNALNFDKQNNELKKLSVETLINLKKSSEVLLYSSYIIKYEKELVQFLAYLQTAVTDTLKLKMGVNNKFIYNKNWINELNIFHNEINSEGLNLLYNYIHNALKQINFNCNKNAVVEGLLFKILEVKYKCKMLQQ